MSTWLTRTRLTDPAGMHFVATTDSGHTVAMDAAPAVGGQNQAPRPGELPYVALSGCTGMDVVSVLRKMRQQVERFEVDVEGLRRAEEHPRRWLEVRVVFRVEGQVDAARLVRAIDLSRYQYCSVAATLKPQVLIRYRYVLNGVEVDLPDDEAPAAAP